MAQPHLVFPVTSVNDQIIDMNSAITQVSFPGSHDWLKSRVYKQDQVYSSGAPHTVEQMHR